MGVWYRAKPEILVAAAYANPRRAAVRTQAFRDMVLGAWQPIAKDKQAIVVTVASVDSGKPAWLAWRVTAESAQLIPLHVVNESQGVFLPLADKWPVEPLKEKQVVVVGAGSIGSAVCSGLQRYALQKFSLIDYDRLEQRNLGRHQVDRSNIGRFKVRAVAAEMRRFDPAVEVDPIAIDAVVNADLARPLINGSDLVVCCTDGVASRRAVNHLAVKASVPVIFSCVLEDGAIGEVLRVLPNQTACLTCHRLTAIELGMFVPEPTLEGGYDTGEIHRPMTAVGGDLSLVAAMTAKVGVATLLERAGYWGQRLPGNQCVIGLQRRPDLPEGYDVTVGEVRWAPTGAPRADCPSCGDSP